MSEVVAWVLLCGKWVGLLVVGTLVTLCVRAGLLGTVMALIRHWVRLCTLIVPADVRIERRAEAESALWEEREAQRRDGYGPDLIAVGMVWQWLKGIPNDIVWSLANLPVFKSRDFRSDVVSMLTELPLILIIVPAAYRFASVFAGALPFDLFVVTLIPALWFSQILTYWFWRDRTVDGLRLYLSPISWVRVYRGLSRAIWSWARQGSQDPRDA